MPITDKEEREKFGAQLLPYIKAVSRRMTFVQYQKHLDDVEGAGEEGFVKALNDFDPSKSPDFEGYAKYRIRRAILDFFKRFRNKYPKPLDVSISFEEVSGSSDDYVESQKEKADARLFCDDIWELADKKLSMIEITILKLYIYDGLTFEEIASLFGYSRSTVFGIYRDACRKLRMASEDSSWGEE